MGNGWALEETGGLAGWLAGWLAGCEINSNNTRATPREQHTTVLQPPTRSPLAAMGFETPLSPARFPTTPGPVLAGAV